MKRRRFPLEPFLVALLFLGPVALALLAYYGPWQVDLLSPTPNQERELIEPPFTLPPMTLEGPAGPGGEPAQLRYRWSLIYARIGPCEDECLAHLVRLRQVRLALGRDRDRVQCVYLHAGSATPAVDDPGLLTGRLHDAQGRLVLPVDPDEIQGGRIFIADPLGNLIASYPGSAEQRGLLEDLERLLELSNIG